MMRQERAGCHPEVTTGLNGSVVAFISLSFSRAATLLGSTMSVTSAEVRVARAWTRRDDPDWRDRSAMRVSRPMEPLQGEIFEHPHETGRCLGASTQPVIGLLALAGPGARHSLPTQPGPQTHVDRFRI